LIDYLNQVVQGRTFRTWILSFVVVVFLIRRSVDVWHWLRGIFTSTELYW